MGGEGLRLKDGLLVPEVGCGRPLVARLEAALLWVATSREERNSNPAARVRGHLFKVCGENSLPITGAGIILAKRFVS